MPVGNILFIVHDLTAICTGHAPNGCPSVSCALRVDRWLCGLKNNDGYSNLVIIWLYFSIVVCDIGPITQLDLLNCTLASVLTSVFRSRRLAYIDSHNG